MARYVVIPTSDVPRDASAPDKGMRRVPLPITMMFLEHVVNTAQAFTQNATAWRMGQRILEAFENEAFIAKLKDDDWNALHAVLESDDVPIPQMVQVFDEGLPTERREPIANPPRKLFLLLCDAVAHAADEAPAPVAIAAE